MILAVHISDGVLRPEWWAGAWIPAFVLIFASLYQLDVRELPRLAMATAFFFVASSIHVPVGGISVHLLLTGLVGAIAGWRSGLVIAAGLFLQSRLIGHGGLLALGFNIVIMALPAIVIGVMYQNLARRCVNRQYLQSSIAFIAGVLGVVITVGLGFVGLWFGAAPDIQTMSWTFVVAHLPIMVIEGFLTASILTYLNRVKLADYKPETGVTSSSGTSH